VALKTAADSGRRLFQQFHLVHTFTGTNRFKEGDPLVRILEAFRKGSGLSDDDWKLLVSREVKDDVHLDDEKYLHGHCGGFVWELVTRLGHLYAAERAKAAGRQLYYIQAVDAPEQTDREWSPEEMFNLLRHPSLTDTGKLPGLVPLYVGMHVRLSKLIKAPFLVQNVSGVVVEIVFHPRERLPSKEEPEHPLRLRFMPLGVLVQLDENPFSAPVVELRMEKGDAADDGILADDV